jgi:TPR repeat protein
MMRSVRPARRALAPALGLAVWLAVAMTAAAAGTGLREGVAAFERGDHGDAAGLLAPLAEAGDARAQYLLGRMCFYGQGLAQDAARAAAWYRRSAEQGYAPAELAFALALDGGWGVARAPREAVAWYRRAAIQGVSEAMWRLAYHYRRGLGVARDLAEAWAWFDRLAAQGEERALAERDWLALVGLDEAALARAKARSDALGLAIESAALGRWIEADPAAGQPEPLPP